MPDEETREAVLGAICPHCHIARKVTKQGRFYEHTTWEGAGFRPMRCPGSYMPTDEPSQADAPSVGNQTRGEASS